MASNTDTLPGETATINREAHPPGRPPADRPPSRSRRALPWVAIAAAAIAVTGLVVTIFTGDDGSDTPEPANRAALAHQADQYIEWLESRAASVAGANRAALVHQADQYVEWLQSRAASALDGGSSSHGSVPGNLPALERQAEHYVEWLESRAASASGDQP